MERPSAGLQPRIQGRPFRLLLLAGCLCTLLAALLIGLHIQPAPLADTLLYDAFSSLQPYTEAEDRIAIVDIDDASLNAIGQWPWPRYRIAALVQKLASAHPRSIGLDILFAEKDQSSPAAIQERFRQEFDLELGFTGIPRGMKDNDGYLGHILTRTRAAGSIYFTFDQSNPQRACPLKPLQATGDFDALDLPQAHGVLCNVMPIQRGLSVVGFINHMPDLDGRLRRLPLLIRYKGDLYPSFTLAILMLHEGASSIALHQDLYGYAIGVGSIDIPITNNGDALIRFYGPSHSLTSYSALSLISQSGAPAELAGRHVILGSSAAGLNDLHHTITDAQLPGAETQATLISNALSGHIPRIPNWNTAYHVLATVIAGLVVTTLFAYTTPHVAALGACCTALLFLGASGAFFFKEHVYLSAAGPAGISFLLLMALSTFLYIMENQRSLARLRGLVRAQRHTLSSMAAVAEMRDPYTGSHISRTQKYVRLLAQHLARQGTHDLSDEYVELLHLSAPLHDVGKVGMPDNILLKPGRLTWEEFELMKKHAEHGYNIIESAKGDGDDSGFLDLAKEIAMTHHERWDGTGYPQGLAGTQIPLSGRLMALADVYDALVSSRLYKEPYSHEEARAIIIEGSGTHFDPEIVQAFLACEDEFIRIAKSGNGDKQSA